MDIRQMNKTHLEHWRGLRKQLWPGHPDDAHLADGEEILQADHLASFIAMADGVAIGFADASSATIMSMAVTVRPWFSLKVFLFSPHSVNAA